MLELEYAHFFTSSSWWFMVLRSKFKQDCIMLNTIPVDLSTLRKIEERPQDSKMELREIMHKLLRQPSSATILKMVSSLIICIIKMVDNETI